MKLDTMEAIDELQSMLNVMPAGQLITIAGQRKEAALKMAIEHLRRAAGYPPNLPGYVTIEKIGETHLSLLATFKNLIKFYPDMSCYLSRKQLEKLAAVTYKDERIVTYTERTCYEDSEPLVCGLPVICGDDKELYDYIYLVAPERKK